MLFRSDVVYPHLDGMVGGELVFVARHRSVLTEFVLPTAQRKVAGEGMPPSTIEWARDEECNV